MKKKMFVLLFSVLSLTILALPWGHRYVTEQNWQNTTIQVGNTLTFSVEWGEGWWTNSDLGYGTTTDGTGWTWVSLPWFENGDGDNKRCKTDVQFNTAGTYYYAYRMEKPETTLSYQHGSETWSENVSTLVATSYVIVEEPLPVVLSSFTAEYVNSSLNLNWTTQSESDNAGWNIYRSDNEILDYAEQINNVMIEGAGTTSEPTEYTFVDENPVVVENTYWYWIESLDGAGTTQNYGPISITIPSINEDDPTPPDSENPFALQNYPNPFSQSTEISFIPKEEGYTEISIYNTKGQKIITLFSNNITEVDKRISVTWNGLDESGNSVLSGIYFSVLKIGNSIYTKKLVITK